MNTSVCEKINVSEYVMNGASEAGLYVGTYGKYNNGSIAGEWIDLEKCEDAEEFFAVCRALHEDEADPEFMFQDYQGFPSAWYSECMGEETIEKILEYVKLSEDDREMVEDFAEYYGDDFTDVEKARDCCMGKYDSKEEFAESIYSECYDIPEFLQNYIDYKAIARDLFMCDYFMGENGYVFCHY